MRYDEVGTVDDQAVREIRILSSRRQWHGNRVTGGVVVAEQVGRFDRHRLVDELGEDVDLLERDDRPIEERDGGTCRAGLDVDEGDILSAAGQSDGGRRTGEAAADDENAATR